MTYSEPAGVLVTILTDGWTPANTNSITPTIDKIYNYKRLSFMDRTGTTFVLITHLNPRKQDYNGSGKDTKEIDEPLKIDIRTQVSEAHAWNCLQEIMRILESNIVQPHADYDELYPFGDHEIFNKDLKGMFHIQKNCSLKDSNTSTR